LSKYPTVDALKTLVERLELDFHVEPATPEHKERSVRVIQLRCQSDEWRVPCFDEYDDARIESRVVRLHLVLDACDCFEEAPNFDTWRRDLGLPDDVVCREMYAQLKNVVPAIRSLVGTKAAPIDPRTIEFNTDLAAALRACVDVPAD